MRTQEQSIRAERKTERSGPKSQMSGGQRESEKRAERDVAERERSDERLNLPLMPLKNDVYCTICTLHFLEAKRGPGPGTSRLDFGGNPMTFFS